VRYLVVEDDPELRYVITSLLSLSLNKKIDSARDGQEAVDFLSKQDQESQAFVIVSDMNMPRLNGLQLANWISKSNFRCKFILMSGYFENAEIASDFPEISYYPKPINVRKMVSEIQGFCHALENSV